MCDSPGGDGTSEERRNQSTRENEHSANFASAAAVTVPCETRLLVAADFHCLRTSDDDDGNRRVASRASCAALIAADAFAAAPIAISAEVEVEVEDDPPLKLLDASRWRALAAAASLAAS